MSDLNDKQKRFIEEYIVDLNGAQAAIRAGYSENCAKQTAHELMQREDVREAVARAKAERSTRTQITADMVLAELWKVGKANARDYLRFTRDGDPIIALDEASVDHMAAVSSVEVHDYKDGRGEDARDVKRVSFRLHNKVAALVEAGKHLGVTQKQELTGPNGTPLVPIINLSGRAEPAPAPEAVDGVRDGSD